MTGNGTPPPPTSDLVKWCGWSMFLPRVGRGQVTACDKRRWAEATPSSGRVLTTFGLKGGSISFLSSSSQLISRNKGCWRMSPRTPSLFSGSLTKSCKGAERECFMSAARRHWVRRVFTHWGMRSWLFSLTSVEMQWFTLP